jgi:hypothetical protein
MWASTLVFSLGSNSARIEPKPAPTLLNSSRSTCSIKWYRGRHAQRRASFTSPRAVLAPRLYLERPSSPSVYPLPLAHSTSPTLLLAAACGRRRHCWPAELMPTAFLATPRLPSSSHEPQHPRRRLLLRPSLSPASPHRHSARPPEPPPPWTNVCVARPTCLPRVELGCPEGLHDTPPSPQLHWCRRAFPAEIREHPTTPPAEITTRDLGFKFKKSQGPNCEAIY